MSLESEIAGLTAAINSLAAALAQRATQAAITVTPPEAAALPPPAAPAEEQPKPKAEKKAKPAPEPKTETITPEVVQAPQEIAKEAVTAAGQKVLDHFSAKGEDGVPKIKALNEKFGCRPSTCPPEKRAEFIAALEALLK